MDPVALITNIIAVSALVPISAFIYFYATRPVADKPIRRRYSRLWRSTEIGRTLMYQNVGWFVFLIFIGTSLFWPDFPGRDFVRIAIYVSLVGLFWRALFTLRRLQTGRKGFRVSRHADKG